MRHQSYEMELKLYRIENRFSVQFSVTIYENCFATVTNFAERYLLLIMLPHRLWC